MTNWTEWLEAAARDYAANAEIKDESMSEGIGLNGQQKLCAEYGFREGATQALQSPVVLQMRDVLEQAEIDLSVALTMLYGHFDKAKSKVEYLREAQAAFTAATQASKANEEKGGE